MFLRNTSTFPTSEVRALVKFATQEIDMRKVCVNVKGSKRGYGGRAYKEVPAMSNAPQTAIHLMIVRVSPALRYPLGWQYKMRAPMMEFHTWQEVMVHLAAHEAKHIEQFKEDLKLSEVSAEFFAHHMLTRYRKEMA